MRSGVWGVLDHKLVGPYEEAQLCRMSKNSVVDEEVDARKGLDAATRPRGHGLVCVFSLLAGEADSNTNQILEKKASTLAAMLPNSVCSSLKS